MSSTVYSRSFFISLLFLFFPFSSPCFSETSLSQNQLDKLLGNLLRGDYYVSYEAEEVTIQFSHGEPLINRYKVGKLKPFKMRREKYAIDGSVEEIMVHDDELQIVSYPKKNIVIRSPRRKTGMEAEDNREQIDLVKKNYRIILAGETVISSRASVIMSIAPREAGSRPSYKVWIDHETSMPLKTETYSIDGSLSFLSTLSNITINPSFRQDYFVIMVPRNTVAYEQPQPETNFPGEKKKLKKFSYYNLGGGYVLKERLLDEAGNLQLIYHDGINIISLFSEDWPDERAEFLKKMDESPGGMVERINRKGFKGYYCDRGGENVMSFIYDKHRYVIVGEVSKEGLVDLAMEFKKRKLANEKE